MAITGFEDITHELTEFELESLVPFLMEVLQDHRGKGNPINSAKFQNLIYKRFQKSVAKPRIRKVVEYLRHSDSIEFVCAGRFGYYIPVSADEVKQWLETMRQKRNAISNSIIAGTKAIKRMTGERQPNQYRPKMEDTRYIAPSLI